MTLLVLHTTYPQVTIREKVILTTPRKLSWDPMGSSVLLRQGGVIKITCIEPSLESEVPGWVLNPNEVMINPAYGKIAYLGPCSQWSEIFFCIKTPNDTPYYGQLFYPVVPSVGILGLQGGPLYFNDEQTTLRQFTFDLEIIPDSSLAQIPPQSFLEDTIHSGGNPYDVNPEGIITLSFEGTYRLIIADGAANEHDDIRLILPNDTTILTNAQAHFGDTIVLGPYTAGTQIQLALTSHAAPIVEGAQLYPQAKKLGVATWEFSFENWTDLNWNDLTIDLEYNAGVADHLELFTIPTEVEYGDTASLMIRAVDIDGNFVPLDSTYQFTITLLDTVGYGYLMCDGWTDNTFTVQGDSGVGKWFQYAATGKIPEDTVVEIPFNLITINQPVIGETKAGRQNVGEENIDNNYNNVKSEKYKVNKQHAGNLPGYRTIQTINQPDTIQNGNIIPEKKREILLGETKYYYLKFYENSGQYAIGEDSIPNTTGVSGVQFSVMRLPVYAARPGEKPDGEKMGVYYEYRNSTGTPIESQIRLIGRYWHEESTYVVKLSALLGGAVKRTALIEVKKPDQLFDANVYDPEVGENNYQTALDIRNNTLNIDSLAIWWGGKIGISPQVVKSQIFQESYKDNNQFYPSYRYEPWKDFEFQEPRYKYRQYYMEQPFFILEEGIEMGEGIAIPGTFDNPIPHENVKPIYYPLTKKKIYQFAIENWGKYFTTGSPLDSSKIPGNEYLTKLWRESYTKNKYFYTPWYGGVTGFDIATSKVKAVAADRYTYQAQTRKAASYGYVQILYTTALQLGFNAGKSIGSSDPPEILNDQVIEMPFYHDFTIMNLQKQFSENNGTIPDGEWTDGWEQTWIKSFKPYNADKNYGTSVFMHARKFYPQCTQ
ncbi:MAG: hypothetical protein C0417_12685 [Chlorobiaceae bacterium]|nr:hypothetical protein [Chlorobiaceae bacterium]